MAHLLPLITQSETNSYYHEFLGIYIQTWLNRGFHEVLLDQITSRFLTYAANYERCDDEIVSKRLNIPLEYIRKYIGDTTLYHIVAFVLKHYHHTEVSDEIMKWLSNAIEYCFLQDFSDEERFDSISSIMLDFLKTPYVCDPSSIFASYPNNHAFSTIDKDNINAFVNSFSGKDIMLHIGILYRLKFIECHCNIMHLNNHMKKLSVLSTEDFDDNEEMLKILKVFGLGLTELRTKSREKSIKTLEFVLRSTAEYFDCGSTEAILNAYQVLSEDQKIQVIFTWYSCMKPIIRHLETYVQLADEYDQKFLDGELTEPDELIMLRLETLPEIKDMFERIEKKLPGIVKDLNINNKIQQLLDDGPFLDNVECKSYFRMLHALNNHAVRLHQSTKYDHLEYYLNHLEIDDLDPNEDASAVFRNFVNEFIKRAQHLSASKMGWIVVLCVKQFLESINTDAFRLSNADFNPQNIYTSTHIAEDLNKLSRYTIDALGVDLQNDLMLSDDEEKSIDVSDDLHIESGQDHAF